MHIVNEDETLNISDIYEYLKEHHKFKDITIQLESQEDFNKICIRNI
jgi:hypothetical protein